MPTPKDKGKDKKDDGIKKLCAPIKKTTMQCDPEHPQFKMVTKREHQKPSDSLESWFDGGLVKQVKEGSDKKQVVGAKPLPSGYSGCCPGKILIEAKCGTLVWPMRIDTEAIGVEEKRPWTLYHFTHKASFEIFHRIFHEMYTGDPKELREELVVQLQNDYQERSPKPLPINLKGEPQLTRTEPNTFGSKEEVLIHIFGKTPAGYSKQGTRFDEFADYCVAVRVPASACFLNTGQESLANVRICRETLEQLSRRKAHMEMEKQMEKERAEEEAELKKNRKSKLKQARGGGFFACFGGFCGTRTQAREDYWDEAAVADSKGPKKDREIDRFKQRLAKKWLDEHVDNVTTQNADDLKKQEKDQQNRAAAEKAERDARRRANGKTPKAHALQVAPKRKKVALDLGIGSFFRSAVTSAAATIHKEKEKTDPRMDKAAHEVVRSSTLYQKELRGKLHSSDESRVSASNHMKNRLRRGSTQSQQKGPTGTKRASRLSTMSMSSKLPDAMQHPDAMKALSSILSEPTGPPKVRRDSMDLTRQSIASSSSAASTSEASESSATEETSESKTEGDSEPADDDTGTDKVEASEQVEGSSGKNETNADGANS